MAVYSSSLPSMHLTGEDLEDLEKAILKDSTDTKWGITISDGDFEYNIDNANEFVSNVDLPEKVTDYDISMRCDEGRIRINAKSTLSNGKIRITGETEWVKKKQRQIYNQFDRNESWIRTHLLKVVWSVWAILMLSFSVLSAAAPESSDGATIVEGILATALVVLITGFPFFSEKLVDLFYPYHLLKRYENVRYTPGLWKIAKAFTILLSVIGGIGGLLTILNSI